MATSVSRSELTRLFTVLLVVFTTIQTAIPSFPIESATTKAIIGAIFMFLVVGLTAWKQYLSVEIRNSAIWPTLFIALVATLQGLNDLIDAIPFSQSTSAWIRIGISTLAMIFSLVSKSLWPSPESKIIEQAKSELTPQSPNKNI